MSIPQSISIEELQTWLRMSEAAHRLGVSDVLVRRHIAEGRLDAVRTPYGHLVDPASVERLAAERAAKKHHRQGV